MLTDRDWIVFSDDWGRNPSSCQHIVRRLLRRNRVLWAETIGMRAPAPTLRDARRAIEKLASWALPARGGAGEKETGLAVVSPKSLPYNHVPLVRRLNAAIMRRDVLRAARRLGMARPIVVTTFPNTADLVGALGESLHVYYCVDDFTRWPGVRGEVIARMEDDLLRRCDLVLATSEALVEGKRRAGVEPYLLEHGVDYEHFAAARVTEETSSAPSPERTPVVGFFGCLSPWLDYELIVRAASLRPGWKFVFVGPADTDVSALAALPNVRLVGPVPYERLPEQAAAFDAAIIPFRVDDLTRSVNPVKLLEYLACGLPVVSTWMPAVERLGDAVAIARGSEEFVARLDEALRGDSPERRRARREIARLRSWTVVAERFSELVETRLEKKRLEGGGP